MVVMTRKITVIWSMTHLRFEFAPEFTWIQVDPEQHSFPSIAGEKKENVKGESVLLDGDDQGEQFPFIVLRIESIFDGAACFFGQAEQSKSGTSLV